MAAHRLNHQSPRNQLNRQHQPPRSHPYRKLGHPRRNRAVERVHQAVLDQPNRRLQSIPILIPHQKQPRSNPSPPPHRHPNHQPPVPNRNPLSKKRKRRGFGVKSAAVSRKVWKKLQVKTTTRKRKTTKTRKTNSRSATSFDWLTSNSNYSQSFQSESFSLSPYGSTQRLMNLQCLCHAQDFRQ